MSTLTEWDLVIIGAGPIGMSAAWNYARRHPDHKVLVIDKSTLMTQLAGSSGEERHWRLQYTEIDIFRLTAQADRLWKELEVEADRQLIYRVGSLWFGDPEVYTNEGQINKTMTSMDEMELPYERLEIRDIEERYGFKNLDPNYEGFLQSDGGVIDVKGTLCTLYTLACEAGVEFHFNEAVNALETHTHGVDIVTDTSQYKTRKAVVAAGPGSRDILATIDIKFEVSIFEMACISFKRLHKKTGPKPFWFAFQQPTESDTNLFYGFPPNPWAVNGFDRLGTNFEVNPITGDNNPTYAANPMHIERANEFVRKHMPFLSVGNDQFSSSCLAVLPTDPKRQFFFDTAEGKCPGGENLVIASGGWTFKFTPLMGSICTDLLSTGETASDISALQF